MAIKNNIIYNKRTGRYLGYIDLGGSILVDDEDTEAKEALVFMLVSLRKSWKYPIGYVLIDKINAGTLNSLLSEALRQSLEHSIKITLPWTVRLLIFLQCGCLVANWERYAIKLYS